jgi:hypothetical protein
MEPNIDSVIRLLTNVYLHLHFLFTSTHKKNGNKSEIIYFVGLFVIITLMNLHEYFCTIYTVKKHFITLIRRVFQIICIFVITRK